MTITITCNGKIHGKPIDDLRDDDLLWLIKSELELGRSVQIDP